MRISWRLWLRLPLVVIVVALIWVRVASQRHAKPRAIADLAKTRPLNQPGGGYEQFGLGERLRLKHRNIIVYEHLKNSL